MIDGSEERKRQLAFELQNLCVFEKRSKRLGGRLHEKQKSWLGKGHPPSWANFSPYKHYASHSRVNTVKA